MLGYEGISAESGYEGISAESGYDSCFLFVNCMYIMSFRIVYRVSDTLIPLI